MDATPLLASCIQLFQLCLGIGTGEEAEEDLNTHFAPPAPLQLVVAASTPLKIPCGGGDTMKNIVITIPWGGLGFAGSASYKLEAPPFLKPGRSRSAHRSLQK